MVRRKGGLGELPAKPDGPSYTLALQTLRLKNTHAHTKTCTNTHIHIDNHKNTHVRGKSIQWWGSL